jgi:hypothetical protein
MQLNFYNLLLYICLYDDNVIFFIIGDLPKEINLKFNYCFFQQLPNYVANLQ